MLITNMEKSCKYEIILVYLYIINCFTCNTKIKKKWKITENYSTNGQKFCMH